MSVRENLLLPLVLSLDYSKRELVTCVKKTGFLEGDNYVHLLEFPTYTQAKLILDK